MGREGGEGLVDSYTIAAAAAAAARVVKRAKRPGLIGLMGAGAILLEMQMKHFFCFFFTPVIKGK